jgi:hypothetical protein
MAAAGAGGLTKEMVNRRIQANLEKYSTVAIQSQHMGNCASDSIQIIMFFADHIGDFWRQFAVNEYNRLGDTLFRQPSRPSTTLENIYVNYIFYSIQRFLRLVGIDPYRNDTGNTMMRRPLNKINASTGMLRRRGSAHNLFASATGVSPTYGVTCSLWIGKIAELQGLVHPENVEGYMSYAYTPQVYDGLRDAIVQEVAPGFARQVPSGGNFADDFASMQRDFPTGILVGVQLFLTDVHDLFHTFTMVKIGGSWYIGDNEVGLLSPPTNYTDEDLFLSRMSFSSDMRVYNDGTKHHVREYSLNGRNLPVEYLGTEGTGVTYEGAIERPEIEWTRRRYFVYVPPLEGGKQKKRKQRKTRRHKKL